jgi:hypothetical protein
MVKKDDERAISKDVYGRSLKPGFPQRSSRSLI